MDDINKLKRYVVWGIVSLVFLILLLFILTRSILVISIIGNKKGMSIAVIDRHNSNNYFSAQPGLNIVPTGDYTVQALQNDSQVKKDISIRPLAKTEVKIQMQLQKVSKKVARGADSCVFGSLKDINNGDVLSYSCNGGSLVFQNKYDKYSKKNPLVINGSEVRAPSVGSESFKNGLIGLDKNPEGYVGLTYVDKSTEKTLSFNNELGKKINNYIITSDNKDIYLFNIKTSLIRVIDGNNFSIKNTYKIKNNPIINQKFASFSAQNGYIYITGFRPSENNGDGVSGGQFNIYQQGKAAPMKKVSLDTLDSSLVSLSPINTSTAVIVDQNQRKANIYHITNDSLEQKDSIDNVSQAVVLNESLYVLRNGNIYKYNHKEKSLNLEFTSTNITVSKIQSNNSYLIFNGYINTGSDNINQTYILENTPLTTSYRIEDLLPYSDTILPIGWMDYFNKNIHIGIPLDSYFKNPNTNQITYSQSELNEKKSAIEDQLKEDGFTKNKYDITYSYY